MVVFETPRSSWCLRSGEHSYASSHLRYGPQLLYELFAAVWIQPLMRRSEIFLTQYLRIPTSLRRESTKFTYHSPSSAKVTTALVAQNRSIWVSAQLRIPISVSFQTPFHSVVPCTIHPHGRLRCPVCLTEIIFTYTRPVRGAC